MNVAEYNTEVGRCQRQLSWRMACAIAPMFAALSVAGIVRYNNPGLADILAPIIMFAIGFPIMLLGFVRADRTYRNFPALVCPHCDGNLSRMKSVIIATGNCPNCGRRVLNDSAIGT